MVERRLAKANVAGSNPVFRSKKWRHSQVVRQRTANPLFPSSNLGAASIFFAGVAELADAQDLKSCGLNKTVPVRFRSPAPKRKGFSKKAEVLSFFLS